MKIVDIFITIFFTYLYLSILLRIFGKKEFSKLNVFDFVVFLVISEIMVMSIGSDTLNFFHSIVATLTIVILDRIVSLIGMHWKKARNLFEGRPSYIIYKGQVDQKKMKELRYTVDDLSHHLRMNDIDSISQVEFAVLETNGSLSVITKENCLTELPDAVISDGITNIDLLQFFGKTKEWLEAELKKIGYDDSSKIFYCVIEKEGLFVIEKIEC